jgi:hypothetical protein
LFRYVLAVQITDSGSYTVNGVLQDQAGNQAGPISIDFELDVINKSLTLTAPNGGEQWEAGTEQEITWEFAGSITHVKLEFTTGDDWTTIADSLPAGDSSYTWTVPDSVSTAVKVRISDVDGGTGDESDTEFEIEEAVSVKRALFNGFTFSIAGQGVVYRSSDKDINNVRVFNFSGNLIKHIPVINKTTVWNGRDENGTAVSNGVYFIRINGVNISHFFKASLVK